MSSLLSRIEQFFIDKILRFQILKYNWLTKKQCLSKFKENLKNTSPASKFLTFNSNDVRKVECLPIDEELHHVILTCYFTKKPDPHFGIVRAKPDIEYIAPWYESVVKLKLKGIVIHDGLEMDFIEQYQNQYVQFRKYDAGNYSIFEERWFAYYLFISQIKAQKVFCTDANDVFITANPFEFVCREETIYIGRDNANKVKDSGWLLDELSAFEIDSNEKTPAVFKYQNLYNAGVTGGHRKVLLFFLARVIDLVLKTTTSSHKDMTLLNLVIHYYFGPNIDSQLYSQRLVDPLNDQGTSSEHIVSGFPLNSGFKKFELNSRAYFIHK